MVVLSLSPLGDLTRFRRKNFNNETFLVTEDQFLRCSGVLLAARSARIEEMLEQSQNTPAVEFSDDLLGLESCLDLVYGGSVDISPQNYKTIFKFGKLYQINEMMDGVLMWISEELDYTEFWGVYLELKKLQVDSSDFIDTIKNYLSSDAEGFMQCTLQLCQDHNMDTLTAVVGLLGGILDKNIINFMINIVRKSTANLETSSSSKSSGNDSKYLQRVVSSTVSYIDKYTKSDLFVGSDKDRCVKALEKVSYICTNMESLRSVTSLIVSITTKNILPTETAITPTTTDLNWELISMLTSPSTSYNTIRTFTERNAQVLHPCVTVEIVIKWWRANKDSETRDMVFISPLLTRINSVSNVWYNIFISDSRYKGIARALGVTEPTVDRYICYDSGINLQLCTTLQQYIRTGGSTVHLPEEWLRYTYNMREHVDSHSVFRYSTNTVPSYGDISGHWFICTSDRHVSLITSTQQELLSVLDNAYQGYVALYFVPLPNTLE